MHRREREFMRRATLLFGRWNFALRDRKFGCDFFLYAALRVSHKELRCKKKESGPIDPPSNPPFRSAERAS